MGRGGAPSRQDTSGMSITTRSGLASVKARRFTGSRQFDHQPGAVLMLADARAEHDGRIASRIAARRRPRPGWAAAPWPGPPADWWRAAGALGAVWSWRNTRAIGIVRRLRSRRQAPSQARQYNRYSHDSKQFSASDGGENAKFTPKSLRFVSRRGPKLEPYKPLPGGTLPPTSDSHAAPPRRLPEDAVVRMPRRLPKYLCRDGAGSPPLQIAAPLRPRAAEFKCYS